MRYDNMDNLTMKNSCKVGGEVPHKWRVKATWRFCNLFSIAEVIDMLCIACSCE